MQWHTILRFKKIDGHIVLFMYENEEDKSDDQCKIIDIIKWDELFGVNNLNEDWFETVIGIENIINPILNKH